MDDLPGVSRVKGGGLKSVQVVLALIAVGLGLAVLKPWGSAEPGSRPPLQFFPSPSQPREAPTASLGPNQAEGIAGQCYYANDWRVFARLESGGRQSRTWVSTDPVSVREPTDPTIPVARVVGSSIASVGYCAPVDEPEAPPAGVAVEAWQIVRGVAAVVKLEPIPSADPSGRPTQALWRPPIAPDGRRPVSWPAGRYVFRLVARDPSVYDRWFGLEIIVIPEPGFTGPRATASGSGTSSAAPPASGSPQP